MPVTSILCPILSIWNSLFKCNYLKNKKSFLNFFFRLWNLHQILNIYEKKMIVIANIFAKLQTVKGLVKPLSRRRRLRISFDSQRVNGCQFLVISSRGHFYHIFWSLWGKMIRKIFPWLKVEILGVFLNYLTPGDIYPVRDCENLQFFIQMELSQNKKLFLHVLLHFWNLPQILNIFEKKMILVANVFPKVLNVKDLVRPLSKKRRFRTSFDIQHVKGFQALVKSSWEHFYHIFWSLWRGMTRKISPLWKVELLGLFVNKLSAHGNYPVRDCEYFKFPTQMQLS